MENLWLLVILMGAVTYLPRMLPLVILQEIRLPPLWHRFLQFVPFAALSALIIPGIFSSTGSPSSAVAGGIAAVILAWLRLNLMVIVAGAILAVFSFEVVF
ncbi:AzlD domain-containing protein [Bacillaceae bacterium]